MAFTTKPEDRDIGVVWLDPALAQSRATHVLIIGVGQFHDGTGLTELKSTPASARELSGWFLDGATGRAEGFANPARKLASLAVVLSEHPGGVVSQVEDGPVPRALFANVQKALQAWITRARTHEDSAAILAIFSHGHAERRRTAVLFEDYGSDEFRPYAGMTEAEQLVDALSTFAPRDKLVILDCCRMQTNLQLPHQGTFGTDLIGGVAGAIPHRPQVMMSTQYDGFGYGGVNGRPTLFAKALLESLRGCAADITDDWRVNSRRLGEITERILGLWREGDEALQVPDTQDNRSFIVTQAPVSSDLTLFVILDERYDLKTANIAVYRGAAEVHHSTGHGQPDPFARISVPSGQPLRLVATDSGNKPVGEETLPAYPPVAFRKLPSEHPVAALVRTERTMGVAAGAAIDIKIDGNTRANDPALITLDRIVPADEQGAQAPRPIEVMPGMADQVRESLQPGTWRVNLRRPGVPSMTRYMRVAPGETLHIDLPPQQSPHEWLEGAMSAGVVSPVSNDRPPVEAPPPMSDIMFNPAPVLRILGDGPADVRIDQRPPDERFTLFELHEEAFERFGSDNPAASNRPVWIEATGVGQDGKRWREKAFVPLPGGYAGYNWQVQMLADAAPPARQAHLTAYAISPEWGPMLAFLGRRAFPEAGAALRALGPYPLRRAVQGKVSNPLAALCGALVAVATHQTEALDIPESWLENLCNWFPALPDGAVVLARHRLHRGKQADNILDLALARGTPVTSLGVDWLSEALRMTGHPRASEARETAMACDPTRVFTVLQLPAEAL